MNNWFLGGSKPPARKKKNTDPLRDLFVGQGNPIVGDKVTRKQRKVLKNPNMKNLFGDWDKDGVINALDCAPRNRKKHMAWRKPQPYENIKQMSPREYLRRTRSGDFGTDRDKYGDSETYYDKDTGQEEPINKLSSHIKNPNVEVDLPFVEDSGDHEGRHRAYAAEKAGIKSIPVRTPAPKSWRTQEVADTFVAHRFPHAGTSYKKSWSKKIAKDSFPEETMDKKSRKSYALAIKEHNPDQEVRDTFNPENK